MSNPTVPFILANTNPNSLPVENNLPVLNLANFDQNFSALLNLFNVGTVYPASPQGGTLCFRTDLNALYIYNGSAWVAASGSSNLVSSITAGAGVSVTNPTGVGAATINNTGVLSITAGAGISVSESNGAATVSVNSNVAFLSAQSPVSTTSATLVSSGQGLLFTPKITGNLLVFLNAIGNNNTAGDTYTISVGYTAGTSLINSGTAMANAASGYVSITSSAGYDSDASIIPSISGLALGTEYAIQPTFAATNGGTLTLTITSMVIMEIL